MTRQAPVALITGGAKRIGQALVEHLAQQGWTIALHYNQSHPQAKKLQSKIIDQGGACHLIQGDLKDEKQVEEIIPQAINHFGRLDLLINNASTFDNDDAVTMTRTSWNHHLEPNLRAPCVLMQSFAKVVLEERKSEESNNAQKLIINMIDQRVLNLSPQYMSYTVSKYALWGLTQTMALALAPHIRVNAIGPGRIFPNIHQTTQEFDHKCNQMPLKTGGFLDDVAAAVDFLWKAKSVTGQLITIDGGQHLKI